MNLYIEIENGQAKNHPALESNLLEAFGSIPAQWESFIRTERPIISTYEVLVSNEPTYAKVNGVWTDVWTVRNMTAEEVADVDQKIAFARQSAQTIWASRYQAANWATWIFDEATCIYNPPIPRPAPIEGKDIRWCGAENNWKEVPLCPGDRDLYLFDYFVWQWVQL